MMEEKLLIEEKLVEDLQKILEYENISSDSRETILTAINLIKGD